MSRIGALLVRARHGAREQVMSRLDAMPCVEVVGTNDDKLAVVIEAASPGDQADSHREIASWPEVMEAMVVFQSGEVEA